MRSEPNDATVRRYAELVRTFLGDNKPEEQFVKAFLEEWRTDRDAGVTTGAIVDALMTAVDAYRPDPTEPWELGSDELRREAAAALAQLTTP